ncbi:hypothetical protein [Ruminococcus sp.]|uniref:hypothetical protein n=1 Tax=Ruminococcus sp. TaxID=41978 RepID=UPI0025869292|nr:hypothetical protein [Ruminococcus sp.]MCR5019765.1 hypothetical protein [Ruminococcus sp.]
MSVKKMRTNRRGPKEFLRKSMVSLKRSPQTIPLLSLVAGFLIYSLNLSSIADTTARINGANMGQCEFIAMLFSILAFVVFLRTFPRRKKADKIMLCLLFAMLGSLIFVDSIYMKRIVNATTRENNPIVINNSSMYINTAQTVVSLHIILICVTLGLLILLPVYSKLLRKIRTSVDVEDNGSMKALDITGD